MPDTTADAPGVVLDPLDRRLLTVLDRDPAGSIASFAEQLGVSARTVARRLARLQATRVVRVMGRTLPGFGGRLAQLVRAEGAPGRVAALARLMAEQEHTRWVRLSRDATELMCGSVTPAAQADEALQRLVHDPRLRRVRVHELLQVWGETSSAVVSPPRDLDLTDRRLLELLERDGRMETSELARNLNVDPSTASRRRRRLLEDGVLYFEADIHPAAWGTAADAMLWIRMSPGRIGELGAALRTHPGIRFTAATSGECSLVAHVVLPDGGTLLAFVDEHLSNYGVQDIDIVPMSRVLKRTR
ncbi:AsnC family transcriptional regulator [Streptomyces sp. LHD-70]|uniref:AsnC family transcriptional regulator n=1 Tax=Streptomyces sp. LHD-70 TaxID=3072140 RepID=UPI00280EDE6F|nr:AsnC family transcriptional regulator [Streptomyces sp. LHD-70]MDQ8705413.1 AsnC family transcriptional regulator [Streptomyces sp. LHD-70]